MATHNPETMRTMDAKMAMVIGYFKSLPLENSGFMLIELAVCSC
jgi:hypothetical protein